MRQRLIDARADRWTLDTWPAERRRLFAIETGQIEDLYLLRRGVTEQLVTDGFEAATAYSTRLTSTNTSSSQAFGAPP